MLLLGRLTRGIARRGEQWLTHRSGQPRDAPLFIVGPARSGTTLIYQSVVTAFRVAYVSNLAVRYSRHPAMATATTAWIGGQTAPRQFASEHGRTQGWRSPAQGYEVWSRWFRIAGDKTADFRWTQSGLAEIRGMVASIERSAGAPFVNKWNGHNAHLGLLSEAFPTALFVRVRRDPVANAVSVYRARVSLRGDAGSGITRVSRSYAPFADADPITQVCAYVLAMERDLDADADRLGDSRFFRLRYETFCASPVQAMGQIGRWYQTQTGGTLTPRDALPERFEASTAEGRTDDLTAAIRGRMNELRRCEFADVELDGMDGTDGRTD